MREAWIVDAVRTPIGRHGGKLAPVRPDDLAATTIQALLDRTRFPASELADVIFGCTNQAGEDKPQRRPHGAPARRTARRGPGPDRQPPLWIGAASGRQRLSRDSGGRGHCVHRGRRGIHEPGTVRDAEAGARLRAGRARSGRHGPGVAFRQPAPPRRMDDRPRADGRGRRARVRRGSDGAGRLRRGQPGQGGGSNRHRPFRSRDRAGHRANTARGADRHGQ